MFGLFSRRKSLPMKEFINDKNSVGELAGQIRPVISYILSTVSDHRFTTVVFQGKVGVGKTTMANVLLLKQLDELLCAKSPQKLLGFPKDAPLHLAVVGSSTMKAKTQAILLHNQLLRIKNFAKHKPTLVGTTVVFEKKSVIVSFEPAYNVGLLGMNVVGGVVETDKLSADLLQKVVPALSERIKSHTTASNYTFHSILAVIGNETDEPWKNWIDEFAEVSDSHKFSYNL